MSGGVRVATSIALLSLGVTILNIGRDVIWPSSKAAPEWIGLVAGFLGLAVVVAAILVAFRVGPKRLQDRVDLWLAPADERALPDMSLGDVVLRVCPHLVDGASPKTVPEGEWSQCGELLVELRQHGRLGRLVLWGRYKPNAGFETHTPLSEISADFWEKADLGYMDFLEDRKGRAERNTSGGGKEWYADIWLNQQQVDKVYPVKRMRLKFQPPLVRGMS